MARCVDLGIDDRCRLRKEEEGKLCKGRRGFYFVLLHRSRAVLCWYVVYPAETKKRSGKEGMRENEKRKGKEKAKPPSLHTYVTVK